MVHSTGPTFGACGCRLSSKSDRPDANAGVRWPAFSGLRPCRVVPIGCAGRQCSFGRPRLSAPSRDGHGVSLSVREGRYQTSTRTCCHHKTGYRQLPADHTVTTGSHPSVLQLSFPGLTRQTSSPAPACQSGSGASTTVESQMC